MLLEVTVFAGPVVLSLMGVAVAIWLPNRGWPRWFWGIAFGLVGVLTIAASVKVVADSGAAQMRWTPIAGQPEPSSKV
jgi:hypothetical protein